MRPQTIMHPPVWLAAGAFVFAVASAAINDRIGRSSEPVGILLMDEQEGYHFPAIADSEEPEHKH